MGLDIKEKNGKFKMVSTVSGERLHDEKWVDLDIAKRILIERHAWKFMENAIKSYMGFPKNYNINGNFNTSGHYYDWLRSVDYKDDAIHKKYLEITKELNFTFDIEK